MLEALAIRDMLLIEAAELRFRPGLNVLTGETGAGKSILLDCLGFVLGWRGAAARCAPAPPRARWPPPSRSPPGHAARAVLEAAGVPAGDELILRRTAGADGRRQAWANDRRVTAETLRALADTLVELHGQQDDRGLLDAARPPRAPRRLRRRRASTAASAPPGPPAPTPPARSTPPASALDAGARDRDFLAHAVAELDRLAPEPGEEPALDARRRQLRAAARIREDIARAAEALGPDGAEGPLLQALRWLEGAARRGRGRRSTRRSTASAACSPSSARSSAEVERVLADLDGEPGELERVEERLFAFRALARKHQVAAGGPARARRRAARPPRRARRRRGRDRRPRGRASPPPRPPTPPRPRGSPPRRRDGRGAPRPRHGAGAAAAEARARALRHRGRARRARPRRRRPGALHRRDQPRRPRRADRPHRLGRRALALPPGAQGLPQRPRPRPHADLRRDRPRRRRRHRRRGRPPPAARWGRGRRCSSSPTRRRSPPAAPTTGRSARPWPAAPPAPRSPASPPAARVEEIARMLAGDTVTDEARAAARALLDG